MKFVKYIDNHMINKGRTTWFFVIKWKCSKEDRRSIRINEATDKPTLRA